MVCPEVMWYVVCVASAEKHGALPPQEIQAEVQDLALNDDEGRKAARRALRAGGPEIAQPRN